MTIAVISDIHFDKNSDQSKRRKDLGDVLLTQAVNRLNGQIKPDVTLISGDILNNGDSEKAEEDLETIKRILDRLDSPYIAIPGNHDAPQELFYRVFDRPEELEIMGGMGFLSFLDRDEPGYNSSRSSFDIKRFSEARKNFSGILVSLQHVSLFPSGLSDCPYNYINSEEIIKAMDETKINLSISGHYHKGISAIKKGVTTYITAPALCEEPFRFLEIKIDENHIQSYEHRIVLENK